MAGLFELRLKDTEQPVVVYAERLAETTPAPTECVEVTEPSVTVCTESEIVYENNTVPGETEIVVVMPEETAQETTMTTETVENEETQSAVVIEETEPIPEPTEVTSQELFDAQLALIPANQLQFLIDRGWTWEITSDDLASRFGYSYYIVGLTYYSQKHIYIADNTSKIRRATLHEFGHALAWELDEADETDEFYDIYYAERNNFTDCTNPSTSYNISSTDEYFASVYQNMLLDYDGTYADVPQTVDYINSVLSEIS